MNTQRLRAQVNGSGSRARKLGLISTLTFEQWKAKVESYQGYCHHCRSYIGVESIEIDHLIPLSSGGPNTIDNVAPSCRKCNMSKAGRLPGGGGKVGRPKQYGESMEPHTIFVTAEQWKQVQANGGAAYIRGLIDADAQRRAE